MKPSQSKALTPRSIINQRKAVESRGTARTKTPSDENKRPVGGSTPGTPSSHFMWKPQSNKREGVTPLGISGKLNRRAVTPSTPTNNNTPSKTQQTPTRSEKAVLYEFEENLLITPSQKDASMSISHTSTVHVDRTPVRTVPGSSAFNRSRSASSLVRSRKGGGSVKIRRSLSEARLQTDNSDADTDLGGGELSRIAVGVRVRPLQVREFGNTVNVEGSEIAIANEFGSANLFTLDHAFHPSTTQEEIYNTMVKPLLNSAFQGYNACLFAYGQTGSGKSYSMMGEETVVSAIKDSTGVIPRFCQELIERVSNANNESGGGDNVHTSTTVEVSYLEIYNEKIRDLLIPPPSKHLRVREHPVYGPYVAELSKHSVNTFNDIQHWITEGNKQRAIAATEMNEKSSRSHSLFMIILTQTVVQSDDTEGYTQENTRRSQINLVDLAGSERIAHSSVSSDRLREGVSINRSLMTLGKVISALVEKRAFVPYRESVLTWLLKESLGGNSRTAMLATISPCSSHQDETMATLRYATQARSILNTVRVNESPQNKIIRELRAEIERLRSCVESDVTETSPRLDSSKNYSKSEEIIRLKSEIQSLQLDVEELRHKLNESEKDKITLQQKEVELSDQISQETDKIKRDYDNLKHKFNEILSEQEKHIKLSAERERALEASERYVDQVNKDNEALRQEIDASKIQVKKLNQTIQDLIQQKTLLKNNVKALEESSAKLQQSVFESQNNLDENLRHRAEEFERKIKALQLQLAESEKETVEKNNMNALFEKEIESWKLKADDLKNQNDAITKELIEETKQKDFWKNQFDKCGSQLETAENRLATMEEQVENSLLKLEKKEKEAEDLKMKVENSEKQLYETSSELEDVKESLKTISLQVDGVSDATKISVSVQTSSNSYPDEVDLGADINCESLSVQKKEYVRLKKKLMEKRKKLESLNAKYIKFENEQSTSEKTGSVTPLKEALARIKELEETVKRKESEIEDMTSELDLLRELETKYKNKLDQSLLDSEEIWSKKCNSLKEDVIALAKESSELKKQLTESQDHVKDLIDQLSKSNLDRQVQSDEVSVDNNKEIMMLERKCCDLQLKLDQKNHLILELEKVGNRAKEEVVVNQTYASELKKQYELLECNLKETKKMNEDHNLRIDELESLVKTLQFDVEKAEKLLEEKGANLLEYINRNGKLEKSLKERDEQLIGLHVQLVESQKLLQEQMSIKFQALKSLHDQESSKKDELDKKDVIAVENIRLKTELESFKEQLERKKKRLEKMKANVDKLEDLLISNMRQSMERKNYVIMKEEHAKVFDCMMEYSYMFHWEFLLKKARSYAHKYHIPYEFEKYDDCSAVVKHLLYNAKSYWFRIDFKLWFENIEKNDCWKRELDENLPWEVDFGSYYKIPNEKPGSLCPLEESACEEIESYCCKPNLICPTVWKKTIAHRHLSGLEDDVRCLLIYFKSSKNQELKELLQLINNLAEQVRDKLSTKS